jgi:hypothetical protein
MTIKTEGQHMGEFLVSEAPGTLSREEGVLKLDQDLKDGTVLAVDETGDLIAHPGNAITDGSLEDPVAGILLGNHDTTSAGPGGSADKRVAYIARHAEVKRALLTFPGAETEGDDAVIADLGRLAIILR